MTDRLEFEGFIGSVHFSAKDETFFGKLEGVNDLITFEGATVSGVNEEFHRRCARLQITVQGNRQRSHEVLKVLSMFAFPLRCTWRSLRAPKKKENLNEFVQEAWRANLSEMRSLAEWVIVQETFTKA